MNVYFELKLNITHDKFDNKFLISKLKVYTLTVKKLV